MRAVGILRSFIDNGIAMTNRPNPLLEKLDPAAEGMMRSLIGGALRTQAIYVAAKLGLADQLALGACDATGLARRVGADAGMLRRVLRFLAFNGVFAEDENGSFSLNRLAESLQTAHPRSLRPTAIRAGEGLWEISGRLLDAVQTGRTPHVAVHGRTFFERVSERGSESAFGSRMASSIDGLGVAIATLDCVRRANTIVDVGGGHGALLAALLRAHPHLRGVLFDREATIAAARTFLALSRSEDERVLDRCRLVPGDFFAGVPSGGDVYLLSWVLHDWDDEQAVRILRSCRDASGPDATILIVEVMMPPRATADGGVAGDLLVDPFSLDLQMLLLTGGRERTACEYENLLEQAGFAVRAITEVASRRGASVIEAGFP